MRRAFLFFVLLGAGALPAAEDDRVVTMSPYEVTANTVQFKRWIKVSSPNFSVYTDVSAAEAMTVVREMEMLHLAAQHFFGRVALRRAPMIFVLPATGSDWRKLESKGHVEWKVAISDPAHTVVDLVLAHYDWQESGLRLVWAEVGAAECYWLNLPETLWCERGVMGFFETAEFTKDTIALGRASSRVQHVNERGWLPWPRLFAVTEQDPEYRRDGEFQRFAGQCIVFVQYLLAHSDRSQVERLMRWNSLLHAGVAPSEAEFQTVFGQDWKAWQKTMSAYISGGSYKIQTLQLPADALKFDILQVDASPREMRELFVLAQILNQDVPVSPLALDALLAKGLQSDPLREILIEACLKWKREEAATEHLDRLIAANTSNPEAYALAARRALARHAPVIRPATRLGAEAAEDIRQLSLRALVREPRNATANNALALAIALRPELEPDAIKSLEKLYRVTSGNAPTSTVISALAIAHARAGNREAAREISEILRDSKFSDAPARALARDVLATLDSPAAEADKTVSSPAPATTVP